MKVEIQEFEKWKERFFREYRAYYLFNNPDYSTQAVSSAKRVKETCLGVLSDSRSQLRRINRSKNPNLNVVNALQNKIVKFEKDIKLFNNKVNEHKSRKYQLADGLAMEVLRVLERFKGNSPVLNNQVRLFFNIEMRKWLKETYKEPPYVFRLFHLDADKPTMWANHLKQDLTRQLFTGKQAEKFLKQVKDVPLFKPLGEDVKGLTKI